MPHSRNRLLRLPGLLLAVVALWLGGCTDGERVKTASELDEPAYREGLSLLKTGRRQEALASFLRVIDKRGEDAPESHLSAGIIYAEHINDPLSAIYHFRKYLALRPNGPLTTQIRQRIDAATREFARTLPAQPLEDKLQRVDLVAAMNKLKQENEALKQELADAKAGRGNVSVAVPAEGPAPEVATVSSGLNFSIDRGTVPTIRTRPQPTAPAPTLPRAQPQTPPRTPPATQAPTRTAQAPVAPAPVAAGNKRHTVQPGDTLSKISQQYYGNRTRVKDIYAANRSVMKSETDLKPGMILRIP